MSCTPTAASTNTTKTATITALVQTGFGDPAEVSVRSNEAAGKRGHVLVRVHAASVRVGTIYTVRGLPGYPADVGEESSPTVIGQHMAGTVPPPMAVTGLTVGDPSSVGAS